MSVEKTVNSTAVHGGRRANSGRKKGTPNKATVSLKGLAGEYTNEAISILVSVMRDTAIPANVRVIAADKLLDRGHGRPAINIEAEVVAVAGVDVTVLNAIYTRNMAKTIAMSVAMEERKRLIAEGALALG